MMFGQRCVLGSKLSLVTTSPTTPGGTIGKRSKKLLEYEQQRSRGWRGVGNPTPTPSSCSNNVPPRMTAGRSGKRRSGSWRGSSNPTPTPSSGSNNTPPRMTTSRSGERRSRSWRGLEIRPRRSALSRRPRKAPSRRLDLTTPIQSSPWRPCGFASWRETPFPRNPSHNNSNPTLSTT